MKNLAGIVGNSIGALQMTQSSYYCKDNGAVSVVSQEVLQLGECSFTPGCVPQLSASFRGREKKKKNKRREIENVKIYIYTYSGSTCDVLWSESIWQEKKGYSNETKMLRGVFSAVWAAMHNTEVLPASLKNKKNRMKMMEVHEDVMTHRS